MIKREFWFALVLFLLTLVSRLLFSPGDTGGFSYDDGNFALAAKSYAIQEVRPHLPGYYLHVKLIEAVSLITSNQFEAMTVLSVIYSALASALLFLILCKWFNRIESTLLSVMIVSNPLVWFYGSITEMYAFDLFFSAGIILLGLSPKGIYWLPLFVGFGTGVRPSSGVLLLPLYIYLWSHHYRKFAFSAAKFFIAHGVGIISVLGWLVPMVQSVGGISNYIDLYHQMYPVEKISLLQNVYRLSSFTVFLVPAFIIAAIASILIYWKFEKNQSFLKYVNHPTLGLLIWILIWWVIPILAFFVFVHYSKGYYLICAAGLLLAAYLLMHKLPERNIVLSAIIVVQILLFLFVPYKLPHIQTYFLPKLRTIGLAEVWLDRTLSHYLTARSHIEAVKRFWKIVDVGAKRVEEAGYNEDGNIVISPKKYLFLDPTFPLSIRGIQVKYPDIYAVSINLRIPNQYSVHTGIREFDRTGMSDMLQQAVVLSRKEFVDGFLANVVQMREDIGRFTIFTIAKEGTVDAAKTYKHLFMRE